MKIETKRKAYPINAYEQDATYARHLLAWCDNPAKVRHNKRKMARRLRRSGKVIARQELAGA